ncbi:hypothetical protein EYF80_041126 [Liparis tanakae]|uniref:Uncharacterized protein n=1 Tax=Liparis tanakae TaxID=230148 RepID=A0A4Z2G571_9TELE|nr:hypothetical protein EYF80_041126 [Liparis tanakae]
MKHQHGPTSMRHRERGRSNEVRPLREEAQGRRRGHWGGGGAIGEEVWFRLVAGCRKRGQGVRTKDTARSNGPYET